MFCPLVEDKITFLDEHLYDYDRILKKYLNFLNFILFYLISVHTTF